MIFSLSGVQIVSLILVACLSLLRVDLALAQSFSPGDEFQDCPECPKMVVVPAGSFMMGSPESEPKRKKTEGPQRLVNIPKPFAVGKYEVSVGEFNFCIRFGDCTPFKVLPTIYEAEDLDLPMGYVRWERAKEYTQWLSNKTGHRYRLLSEAEWEYAARAGTTTPFAFGDRISSDQANFDGGDTYNGSVKGLHRRELVPVDSLSANQWGIHHMHGNSMEWVEDCWNKNYIDAPTNGEARTTGDCKKRVTRSGFHFSSPEGIRSASRGGSKLRAQFEFNGFRVAREIAQ